MFVIAGLIGTYTNCMCYKGVEKKWLGYALPQGYSEYLSARPSQQLDVDWGNSVHQLKHIMTNAVPCKLFLDKSILCVGQEMIPQPKGKRVSVLVLLHWG